MNYGIPYQGSKNRLVNKLLPLLPKAKHFYDVFAGGCAMTHGALLSGRYEHVHANDISDAPQLFVDAVNGKYHDEKRWISREDFFRLKDTDPYVRCCWSFGNNGKDYLYSRVIEPYKRALHHAVLFGEFSLLHQLCPEVADSCEKALRNITDTKQRRLETVRAVVKWLKAHGTPEMVEANPLYKSCHKKAAILESLERLQRLESLESLERLGAKLEVTWSDYRKLSFEEDCIIFCDPPYKGTKGYQKGGFDHEAFYEWARKQKPLTIISEYAMPEDFVCIAEISHLSRLNSDRSFAVKERLFVPKKQEGRYKDITEHFL